MISAVVEQLAAELFVSAVRWGWQRVAERGPTPDATWLLRCVDPSAAPEVSIVSLVPGRLRARDPSIRGDRARSDQVQRTLLALPGVLDAKGSPMTGSVLIRYDPDVIDVATIFRVLATDPALRKVPRASAVMPGRTLHAVAVPAPTR